MRLALLSGVVVISVGITVGCAEALKDAAASSAGTGVASAGGAATSVGGSAGEGVGVGGGSSGPCADAIANKQSVGCEYYATYMDSFTTTKEKSCYAAVVANTTNTAVHIDVEYAGEKLPVGNFARIPSGSGPTLAYGAFDPVAGLPPGEVVILFLSGLDGEPGPYEAPCPVPSAIPTGVPVVNELNIGVTGVGKSFRITSDLPVVAYQINPFGGGSAAATGASLLLPTSAWDTNYIAANVYHEGGGYPSMNIVAAHDDTTVTMLPIADVQGGGGIPAAKAGAPLTFKLARGEHAQLTQAAELTGSVVQSDKPVGFMAGHQCMEVPAESLGPCDHGEQMVPPVRALGSEYVGVMYKPRKSEPALWRVIGAVDGTELSWSSPVGGSATLERGQLVEFVTGEPFVVRSQDEQHPFILFQYMSSNGWKYDGSYSLLWIGDPDSVLGVPPQQFMSEYVFFADPTYPITNIVVVRAKKDAAFADVTLDCAGVLGGWQPVGDYEWTRADLSLGLFESVGACNTGRHEIKSDAPFGLWVWGWGSDVTQKEIGINTQSVSYGYPGGMNVGTINDVVVEVPK